MDRWERQVYGAKPGVTLEGHMVGGLLKEEVRGVVQELAIKNELLPVEPSLERESGRVIPGRDGCQIQVDQSIQQVMEAGQDQTLSLVRITIPSCYQASDLQEAKKHLGDFQTRFSGSYQRYRNIALAADGINYTVVWPGQVFSFNEVVGPRTPERGFLPAPVLIIGGSDLEYGGGVCQLASTLYNAVLHAGLQVVERHPHSRPVSYVPPGQDATVDYGAMDFSFRNSRSGPVIVQAGIHQDNVWVYVLGKENKS
ncbi:MAG TPA: VanW family protein [Syntrophomonadaceae bacterium]|nr:VanW family protein [Syntrophomonadaceae bacterium]